MASGVYQELCQTSKRPHPCLVRKFLANDAVDAPVALLSAARTSRILYQKTKAKCISIYPSLFGREMRAQAYLDNVASQCVQRQRSRPFKVDRCTPFAVIVFVGVGDGFKLATTKLLPVTFKIQNKMRVAGLPILLLRITDDASLPKASHAVKAMQAVLPSMTYSASAAKQLEQIARRQVQRIMMHTITSTCLERPHHSSWRRQQRSGKEGASERERERGREREREREKEQKKLV